MACFGGIQGYNYFSKCSDASGFEKHLSVNGDPHDSHSRSSVFRIDQCREFCIECLQERLLSHHTKDSLLPARQSYHIGELLDILRERAQGSVAGSESQHGDDEKDQSLFQSKNLQKVCRILLDFIVITEDFHLLDLAFEAMIGAISIVNCSSKEAATDIEAFLLSRSWSGLQSNCTNAMLAKVACVLMNSLCRKDPLAIVQSTQTSSPASAFLSHLLDLNLTKKSNAEIDENERNVLLLKHLWICHTQYSNASFLKSYFLDNGTRILQFLLSCHLRKNATIPMKIQCSDFILALVEQGSLNLEANYELEFLFIETLRRDSLKKTFSVFDLLVYLAKDCLMSSNAKVVSNGTRIASFIVGYSVRAERQVPLESDFVDHVINVNRSQVLMLAKGDAQNQNLQDSADFACIQIMHDICTLGNPPASCLHCTIDVCILWLDHVNHFLDNSFEQVLFKILCACLERVEYVALQHSTTLKLMESLEKVTYYSIEDTSRSLANYNFVLRIVDAILSSLGKDLRTKGQQSKWTIFVSHASNLVLRVVHLLSEQTHEIHSQEYLEILKTGLDTISRVHQTMTSQEFREVPHLSLCLQEVRSVFRNLVIPLVLLCISGEQSKVQTLSKSFLSLLNQFLSVENVSYDTHLDAELKSLATQLLDNNIIVLLANLASREKSEDLFDDASSLIKKVICIVTGKELRFEMLNSLMHSENPLTKLIKEVVIKGGEDFCKKFEDSLLLLLCVLFHYGYTGENSEVADIVYSAMKSDIVSSHHMLSLYCKAVLGFLDFDLQKSPESSTKSFPLASTPSQLAVMLEQMPAIAHVGLLAWNCKNPGDSLQIEMSLLSIFIIESDSDSYFQTQKLLEFAAADELATMTEAVLSRVTFDYHSLDSTKILNVVTFVRQLSESPSFRESIFSSRFLSQAAEILRILMLETKSVSPVLQEAALEEVFYMIMVYTDNIHEGEGSTISRWHPFLAAMQDIIVSAAHGKQDIDYKCFPMAMHTAIFTRLLTTVESMHEFSRITLNSLAWSANCITSRKSNEILSGKRMEEINPSTNQEAWQLVNAVLCLEKCLQIERWHQGKTETNVWLSFPFSDVTKSLASIVQDCKLLCMHETFASIISSLFVVWKSPSLDDEVEENIFLLYVFSQERVASCTENPMLYLDCMCSILSSQAVHKSLRDRLLSYPWNEDAFQQVLSGSVGSNHLMHSIFNVYKKERVSTSWLGRLMHVHGFEDSDCEDLEHLDL